MPIEKEEKMEEADPKKMSVIELKGLSTRTLNALEKNSIKTVAGIVKMNETKLLELEGMGEKSVKEIKKAIGELGLNLKTESKE